VYFENTITPEYEMFNWNVTSNIGRQQNQRWTFIPTEVGIFNIEISVHGKGNEATFDKKSYEVYVVDNLNIKDELNLLFIGDSTIQQALFTKHLLKLSEENNSPLNLLGTVSNSNDGNRHEGRGGWTVSRYLKAEESPFINNGKLDFANYMYANEYNHLDYVFIHLGINDIFHTKSDEQATLKATKFILGLKTISDNIHSVSSRIKIGIMLTIPPSKNQDAFGHNYSTDYVRWRYKRNLMILTRAIINEFSGNESNGIYLIPVNLNIDPVFGFPSTSALANSNSNIIVERQSNALHPNETGYKQMADVVWSWLNYQESIKKNFFRN
tara:strand:+ start:1105 stop:2082 length:978 start_codon:yes stop_codon:yes gene_type:complete